MLKITICDDEPTSASYFSGQIDQLLQKQLTDYQIEVVTDSLLLRDQVEKGQLSDIYFLDIDMPHLDGLALGEQIRQVAPASYLIYLSIHEEFVFDSFKNRPFRFIPKDKFDLWIEECLQALLKDLQKTQEIQYFKVEGKTSLHTFPLSDILYIVSLDKYIRVKCADGALSEYIRYRISDAERKLAPYGFLRIHKSYLVSYKYIRSIHSSEILLDDGTSLPVSRSRLDEVRAAYRRLTL